MNNNYISIRKTNTSKISQQIKRNINTSPKNNILNSHYSSKFQSDYNSKNIAFPSDNFNKLNKNNNTLNAHLLLKRGQLNPNLYNRDIRSQYYENPSNKANGQTGPKRENINQRLNINLNNNNVFNDKQNHLSLVKINSNYENANNVEKNRENYSYYESKYSKNSFKDKENNKNLFSNKLNENNFILYSNENKNILNLNNKNTSKRIINESNKTIKSDITNCNMKNNNDLIDKRSKIGKLKTLVNVSESRNKKRALIIRNKNLINNTTHKTSKDINVTQNKMNNYILPHSSSITIENYKDRYHSPKKPLQGEKSLSEIHNNSNVSKIRLEKYKSSKNVNNIDYSKINFTPNDNKNYNKKIQMINEFKSSALGIKKSENMSIRKIPISPREKNTNSNTNVNSHNKNQNINSTLSNIKLNENGNKIKDIHSYTATKLQENKYQYGQTQIRKNLNKQSFIKGINILDNNKFTKSVSTEINYTLNSKITEKDISLNYTNNNTRKLTYHDLPNDENIKKSQLEIEKNDNIEEVKYMNNKNKELASHKVLINNKLKKQKSEIILKDKFEKRMKSQQQLIFNKRISNENIKDEKTLLNQNSKIMTDKLYEYNTNNSIEKKFSKKNKSNKNLPIINNNLSRNNNNNNKVLHTMDIINNNFVHEILTSKTNPSNPQFLEKNASYYSKQNSANKFNNLSSAKNQKQKSRRLSDFSKYESRPSIQIYNGNMKNNEIDNEEEWDHSQYMGIRKTTYDPGSRPRKNKNKNKNIVNLLKNAFLNSEFSKNTYIKSCESITVPGKKENGNKKINQDSFIIERNINGILNFNIFGVLDGHGEFGHYASQFVSRYVISHIKNHPLIKKCDDPKEIYQKLILNGYEIIANLFTDADVQIQKEKFDVQNSGTTCVIVIQLEEKIICANTGDSRAIIIYNKDNNDNLVNTKIYNLSYDCKPELPNECKRIYECGGCVERALDDNDQEGGPYRVWVYGEDYPGLAMSRSIGDLDAKKIGVIPNPQIVEYTIDSKSKYMLIASDGIWEFISNEEAMRIGNKFYLRNDANGLCNELYKESVSFWLKEDCIIDDITLIVVFF